MRKELIDHIIKRALSYGDFDVYRTEYQNLTFEEKKEINKLVCQSYPNQDYSDKKFFITAFEKIVPSFEKKLKVVELGGYDGALAKTILMRYPNIEWINYDILAKPPVKGLEQYNYKLVELFEPFENVFENEEKADIFVSSDTLEHFSEEEVKSVLNVVKDVPYLILQIYTIYYKGHIWSGDKSTHVLYTYYKDIYSFFGTRKIVYDESDIRTKVVLN